MVKSTGQHDIAMQYLIQVKRFTADEQKYHTVESKDETLAEFYENAFAILAYVCDQIEQQTYKLPSLHRPLLSHHKSFSDELDPAMCWTEDYNSAKRELQQLMNKYY